MTTRTSRAISSTISSTQLAALGDRSRRQDRQWRRVSALAPRGVTLPACSRTAHGGPGNVAGLVLGAGVVANGLMVGLFAGFSYGVMPGLAAADDRTFVTSMQNINRLIQNPLFALIFTGALLLPAASVFLERRHGCRLAARWVMIGTAGYVGTLAVTVGVNIPLNDRLDTVSALASAAATHAARADFEPAWTVANDVRALVAVAATTALVRALLLHGQRR